MRRRYRIVGPVGQQETESGDIVAPGGVITLDDKDERTQNLLDLVAITLEADEKVKPAEPMPCPLCHEQGKKSVPKLATAADLEAHYTDKHPGFVVPTFTVGGEQ
jgi:hypothetical protein